MLDIVKFIQARLLKSFFVILAIVVLSFVLVRMAPGDPAAIIAGEAGAADEAYVSQLRQQFGLDKPLYQQLGIYLKGVSKLDLGYSYRRQQSVLTLLLDRLPATLLLTGMAFFIAIVLGIMLGAIAAVRAGTWTDTIMTVVALACYATPIFWIGLMLVLLFSVKLNWLPAFGMTTAGIDLSGIPYVVDVAKHLVLPALTLGLFYMAVYARLTRSSMLETADLDFVKTARAKGVSEGRVVRRHILRNAILPVITMAGVQAGQLIGGAIVVETVFAWPGIGRLSFEALLQRDYPILLGVFFISAVLVVVVNLLTDLLYIAVDPRIEVNK